jgi:hypothetical protein
VIDTEDTNDDAFFGASEIAQDEGYESVIVARRVLVTDETSGFAETIDVKDKTDSLTTAADVLSRSAGVQVRRLGGLGSPATLSILK